MIATRPSLLHRSDRPPVGAAAWPRLMKLVIGLSLVLGTALANAHHGFGAHYYPDRMITIEGTVRQFDFVNPHAVLYIDATDEAGEAVVYVCALQARTQLVRRGADETLFTVGEPIRVDGFPARRDEFGCEFGTGHFADGSSFTMRSYAAETQFAQNRVEPLASGATRSVFGNWIRPTLSGGGGLGRATGQDSITAEGERARAAYDPIHDNPVLRCDPTSPVRLWRAPGLVTSIRQVNSQIFIYHESMDVTRTIHMNLREHPADLEPSTLGHSIGRFEDGALVIDSANFEAGVIFGSDLHTENMTMTERLMVNPDSGDLEVAWTIYDEAYFAEPLTGSQNVASTDQKVARYECIPEALPASL